ncbi:phosphopentomutase [Pseudothermotoga thermarum]|uniref:Phosphopentomutase n=1 Tax=Pseudothermotoga thermarum DSM 5069 TaxID=688269 RepID=F7YUD4_9THEM|nr:phosphopentomutase [Pseudothermotoga thermarum]AEH51333.1 phosphopentomutase [Pseudothermotoga thermarum DSM 5069]
MRVIAIVLDSVGIGELPDSHLYGDQGSNTLVNTAKAVGGLNLPNLAKMGLGNLDDILGVPKMKAIGAYGIMHEKSPGKDSTTGHWELAGIILKKPFDIFPNGFPKELIEEFERRTRRKVIGNKPASGTEIIKELGPEHEKTGALIVYTSADSVFQIAAKEEIIPVEELYKYCEIARKLLDEMGYKVGRVIARPFTGKYPNYVRTPRRHDYSLEPEDETLLDILVESGIPVYGIGKIYDLYAGRGITQHIKTEDNLDGILKTIEAIKEKNHTCMIFTNLVDFDMKYGHRNDPYGYAKALEQFDQYLPEIWSNMKDDDFLFITADHGCDPTTPSTDHSRERVPILVCGKIVKQDVNLGIRETFADFGQTIADLFGVRKLKSGTSFKDLIIG